MVTTSNPAVNLHLFVALYSDRVFIDQYYLSSDINLSEHTDYLQKSRGFQFSEPSELLTIINSHCSENNVSCVTNTKLGENEFLSSDEILEMMQ